MSDHSNVGTVERHRADLGAVLGTVSFLLGGEYFGLSVRAPSSDVLEFDGLATSFVATRPVSVSLAGSLVADAATAGDRLRAALGSVWDIEGSVTGAVEFPFLECEAIGFGQESGTGHAGALVRLLSAYGEQVGATVSGCGDLPTAARLAACCCAGLALSDAFSAAPDRRPSRAELRLLVVGQEHVGPVLAGEVCAR